MGNVTFISEIPEPTFSDYGEYDHYEAAVLVGRKQVNIACLGVHWNFLKINYALPFGDIAEIIAHLVSNVILPRELQDLNHQVLTPEIDDSPPYISIQADEEDLKLNWSHSLSIIGS